MLAALQRSGGARFVLLAARLQVHQAALRQTLDDLIGLGLVKRNEGHGHPARPEYVLTAAGRRAGPACDALLSTLERRTLVEECLRKWSLPVLHAIGEEARRYGEVRERLPSVTDRALAGALKELEAAGLVKRRVSRDYPPVVRYEASPSAIRLVQLLNELAAGKERS